MDVGARRHRLRLERLELSEGRGVELVGDDAAQILFERQLVDDGEGPARVAEDLERAAIRACVDLERRECRLDAHARVGRPDDDRAAVDGDGEAILHIRRRDHTALVGVDGQDRSEGRGSRRPALHAKRLG